MNLRVNKLSKIVARNMEIMFMVIPFTKINPACQTKENGIKPEIYLNTADKRVAEPSQSAYLNIKQSLCDV